MGQNSLKVGVDVIAIESPRSGQDEVRLHALMSSRLFWLAPTTMPRRTSSKLARVYRTLSSRDHGGSR